jgi:hypothetical protein
VAVGFEPRASHLLGRHSSHHVPDASIWFWRSIILEMEIKTATCHVVVRMKWEPLSGGAYLRHPVGAHSLPRWLTFTQLPQKEDRCPFQQNCKLLCHGLLESSMIHQNATPRATLFFCGGSDAGHRNDWHRGHLSPMLYGGMATLTSRRLLAFPDVALFNPLSPQVGAQRRLHYFRQLEAL